MVVAKIRSRNLLVSIADYWNTNGFFLDWDHFIWWQMRANCFTISTCTHSHLASMITFTYRQTTKKMKTHTGIIVIRIEHVVMECHADGVFSQKSLYHWICLHCIWRANTTANNWYVRGKIRKNIWFSHRAEGTKTKKLLLFVRV